MLLLWRWDGSGIEGDGVPCEVFERVAPLGADNAYDTGTDERECDDERSGRDERLGSPRRMVALTGLRRGLATSEAR